MTIEEVLEKVPALQEYIGTMPEDIRKRCVVKVHPPGFIIHQKDAVLDYFGIVASGEHRVINEFENGNVFMIERNEPIDFIGEVTILANQPRTSVTIETTTENIILYMRRQDFENWIKTDIHFLRLVASKIAFKLYRSSYNRGAKLFYPPQYLLLDFLIQYAYQHQIERKGQITVPFTRQELFEEIGVSVKTLNRTIAKLKAEQLISITKGKITMTVKQTEAAKTYLKEIKMFDK